MNRTIFTLILAGGILLASCAPKEKKAGAADAATLPTQLQPSR
jgi:hypothetical protein